jgi:hypothetical protein
MMEVMDLYKYKVHRFLCLKVAVAVVAHKLQDQMQVQVLRAQVEQVAIWITLFSVELVLNMEKKDL